MGKLLFLISFRKKCNLVLISLLTLSWLSAQDTFPNFYSIKAQWEEKILNLDDQPINNEATESKYEDGDVANYFRWYFLWRFRHGDNGDMRTGGQFMNEVLNPIQKNKIQSRAICDSPYDNITWTNLGPVNSTGSKTGAMNCFGAGGVPNKQNQGRVECISVNPNQQNEILIGAWNGGIWGTTNGGTTWTNKTDNQGYSLY